MSSPRRSSGPLGWLAALGLACLASSVLLRRRPAPAGGIPTYLYQGSDEFQRLCYR